jgi:predicted phage terminase large subunit-like protein
MALTEHDLQFAIRNIAQLDPIQKARVLSLVEEREKMRKIQAARDHFLPFVTLMWPDFIPGAHHTIMAEAFEEVVKGNIKRLIINMPPRFTKSELSSWLLPAWVMGRKPTEKVIQASNTEALASGFGRKVRNLISGDNNDTDQTVNMFKRVFPNVWLAKDSQAAAGWHTNRGGEYFAIGVNGKVTGKGASLAVLDDLHSEQEAKQAETNPAVFDMVWSWYSSGIRQRLQPGGKIVIPMTRWSKRDIAGRLIKQMQDAEGPADKWEVISFPAILDEGEPTERSMWPGFWPLDELQKTRAALPVAKWQAQYMQEPTSDTAAILKREYWRIWGEDKEVDLKEGRTSCPSPQHAVAWGQGKPPACDYIIQSWDCATGTKDRSHPSAMTEWGVFRTEDSKTGKTINNIFLLSSFKRRMEFPELKAKAKQFYEESMPDSLLIENKSAGIQLLQEFRAMGIPALSFDKSSRGKSTGVRGVGTNDKTARANIIVDIFASGYVWAPDTRFAEEVIMQCADFPNGEEDDLVDTTVQAMMRFRAGGLIRTEHDEEEERDQPRARRRRYY